MIAVLNIFTIINLTLLGALLFFKNNNSAATKILGLIVFIPATAFASNYFLYTGLMKMYPGLVFINLNFLWAPLVFWYVLLTLDQQVTLNLKKLIHLVLYALYFLALVALLFQEDTYIQNFLNEVSLGKIPWQCNVSNFVMFGQFTFYLIYSYIRINSVVKKYKNKGVAEIHIARKIKWVKTFMQILLLLNFSAIVIGAIVPLQDAVYLYYPLLYDITFYFVIYGAVQSSSILSVSEFHNYEKENKEKYANSCIQPIQMEASYQKLLDYFKNEKPYLKPELSLNDLSSQINVSQHFLSQLINQKLNMSFSELINSYRIEEAKLKLKDIEQTKHSIEGIGLTCGFGSPASFYRAFKKNTGFTPSQYINHNKCL